MTHSAAVRATVALIGTLCLTVPRLVSGQDGEWRFLAAGDARNCGDVVMPAIAETAKQRNVSFYWHLGDLRYIAGFDEDIQHQKAYVERPLTISAYLGTAWPDFIKNQIEPFGSIPFMLGIGNHEVVEPKTRNEFLVQFADWLNAPTIRNQRLADDPADHRIKTYYHWIDRGVDFIFLDNASNEQVTAIQLAWFNKVIERASTNPAITTIVMGMHKPLPLGYNTHSMDESPEGVQSGKLIYASLLQAQNQAHKRVYVLASHQHFYMENVYDTEYWRQNGGVLPGWVVGTSGAQRNMLPTPSPAVAMTNVYGSLVGTVKPNGEIAFTFEQVREQDVPWSVVDEYGPDFVHWCFAENTNAK
jgi:hypothetical protein